MFAKELNDLAERKRLILLEADLHRSLIGLGASSLWAKLDSVRAVARPGNPWLLAGSAVAGLIAVRYGRGLARWIPTALAAWRWFRRLRSAM
jgi:hypothetical protein